MSSRHDPPPAATEVIPFPGTESSLGSEEQTPDPRELHIMGILRARAGDLQGGLELLEQAVELAPHVADFRGSVGVAHARSGRIQEAANCFEAALQCDPNRRDYRFRLGDAYLAMGRYLDAESCYQSLLPHLARNARLHVNLGTAQLQLGKMAKAQASYVTATRLDPTRTRAWVSLGQLLLRREPMKAAQCFRRVLEIDPEDPDALAGSAGVRERMGDPEGALAELEPHKHLANESTNIAVTYARVCRRAGMADRAVPVLRASMNRAVVRHEEISLHHALGTTLDSLDEVDHAFDAHERANSLRQLIFDTAGHGERIDALIRTFDPQAFGRIPHASSLSDRPVFIVGMPRSGTSLVEQVLASHPLVYGAGELKSIPQIATLLPRQLGSQQGYPDCIDEVPKRVLD
ncbi:MAG: tetratricopeptide repeat protein, partial [Myxococcota bacterium]|nr:tetratricopeptide repeat protein [Myxococcota bacterium]